MDNPGLHELRLWLERCERGVRQWIRRPGAAAGPLRRIAILWALTVICAIAVLAHWAVAAETQPGGAFARQAEMLRNIATDLIDMAKAKIGDTKEYEVASDLSTVASNTAESLDAASDLLWLFDFIHDSADRSTAAKFINFKLDGYSRSLDVAIQQVNLGLVHSRNAGIAERGKALRNALREGQSLLAAAKVK